MQKNIVKMGLFLGLLLTFASLAVAAIEEYPLFTTLEGFSFDQKHSKSEKFGSYGFRTGQTGTDKVTVEGKYFELRYHLNKGIEKPGDLTIIRNFTNAVRQNGGEVLREGKNDAFMRILQGDKEIWAHVHAGNSGGLYYLNIIEKGVMKQEVAVNKILDALDSAGKATVYINFDTASSQMKADAGSVITDILDMLRKRPDLKLSIEGHTDGDGSAEGNQKLSEDRAMAIKTALTTQGIETERLATKGYGASHPVADNSSEEGKAKNRRVELVKRL
jgi:outer membrane protein OmpA-like peptidoglycan-associated protein